MNEINMMDEKINKQYKPQNKKLQKHNIFRSQTILRELDEKKIIGIFEEQLNDASEPIHILSEGVKEPNNQLQQDQIEKAARDKNKLFEVIDDLDEDMAQFQVSSDYYLEITDKKTDQVIQNTPQVTPVDKSQGYVPNSKEIQHTLDKITKYIRDPKIEKVLRYFYRKWRQDQQQKVNFIFFSKKNPQYQPYTYEESQRAKQLKRQLIEDEKRITRIMLQAKDLQDMGNKYSNKQKQIAARMFLSPYNNEEMVLSETKKIKQKQFIPRSMLKSVFGVMIIQVIQNIERSLSEDFQVDLNPIPWNYAKLLTVPLLNYNQEISQVSETFRKYIKVTFKIEVVSITKKQAMSLYQKILQELRKILGEGIHFSQFYVKSQSQREKTIKYDKMPSKRKQQLSEWPKEKEEYFINQFLRFKNLQKVKSSMTEKYGPNSKQLNVKIIREKLQQIFRAALKDVINLVKRNPKDFPPMPVLKEFQLKKMLTSPNCQEVRLRLCKIYQEGTQNQRLVSHTISAMIKLSDLLFPQNKQSQLVSQSG